MEKDKKLSTANFIISDRDTELHKFAKYLTEHFPIGEILPAGNLLKDIKDDVIKEAIHKGCMVYYQDKLLHTIEYGNRFASYINLHDALYLGVLLFKNMNPNGEILHIIYNKNNEELHTETSKKFG